MKLWLSKCSVIIIYLFINMYNFELLVHHLTHLTHCLTHHLTILVRSMLVVEDFEGSVEICIQISSTFKVPNNFQLFPRLLKYSHFDNTYKTNQDQLGLDTILGKFWFFPLWLPSGIIFSLVIGCWQITCSLLSQLTFFT